MGAVTYPNEKVVDFITENLIPLQISNEAEPYIGQFNVKWTPRIFILDPNGKEHQSTLGFMKPENFIPSLELGMAKVDFDLECFEDCLSHLDHILTASPESSSAPEAVYLKGVAGYKKSGDAAPLKDAYNRLQKEYPDSEWTERASPYRLL
jgi:hypothetical protein